MEHRIVERLGNFEVAMVSDQSRIDPARIAPEVVVFQLVASDQLYRTDNRSHLELVQINTLRAGAVDTQPVGIFESRPGPERNVLKLGEIGLKPVEDNARKALAPLHENPVRKRG